MVDSTTSIRQTVVFAATLVALLSVARSGAAALTMQVAFTVFIAIATIWLRGQYVDSLDNEQWVIPRRLGIVLLAVAFLLFGSYFVVHQSGLALFGVLLAYFVAGSAMTEIRQSDDVRFMLFRRPVRIQPLRWGPWLTVVGLLLAVAGFAALGHGTGLGWLFLEGVLLGAPLLLLIPVGLSLLSERAMRWLSQSNGHGAGRRWLLGGAGASLFCGMAVVAVALSRSLWLLGTMAIVGLLVIALVSATQADIVAVMAVVALMGVTPLQAHEPDRLNPDGHSRVLVALGDSYMSGEGASIYYEGTDEGEGNQCRRSPTSWAAMAAQLPLFDGFDFLACSGAQTANLLPVNPTQPVAPSTPKRVGIPVPAAQVGEGHTQLDAYRADHVDGEGKPRFSPELVVVSVGGNDAGFSTIGLMCLAPGDCSSKDKLWISSLEQVRTRLRTTYFEIDAAFPDTPVVVIPYPDPIDLQSECSELALSRAERRFVHRFLVGDGTGVGLNKVIEETAEEFGFYYLAQMQNALGGAHLQLCDPLNEGRPGLNFIGLRSVRGIAEQRFNPANWSHSSLHPNERGHAAMLRVFQTWRAEKPSVLLARETRSFAATTRLAAALNTQAQTAPEQATRTASENAPQCDLFDPTPAGCRPQGQRWAAQQVGMMVLTKGWIGVLAAAGAWAAAVALFSWRRRTPVDR